jgi:YfiH family protein
MTPHDCHDASHSHSSPPPVPLILRPLIFESWIGFTCGMTTAAVARDPEAPRLEIAAALPLLLGIDELLPVAVGEQVHGDRLVWIGHEAETAGADDSFEANGMGDSAETREAGEASEPSESPDEDRPSDADIAQGPLRFFGRGKGRADSRAAGSDPASSRLSGSDSGGAGPAGTGDEATDSSEPFERMLEPPEPGEVLEAPGVDGLLTLEPDLLLGVFTADCVPVVIADPRQKAVAVVHAGREGTRLGIVRAAVDALVASGSRAEDLCAWVGPSISSAYYEVSADMAADFRDHFGHYPGAIQGPESRHLALGLINWYELVASGLARENVELDARCTFHDATLFHSYRRDGAEAGRMLTFAGFLGVR